MATTSNRQNLSRSIAATPLHRRRLLIAATAIGAALALAACSPGAEKPAEPAKPVASAAWASDIAKLHAIIVATI